MKNLLTTLFIAVLFTSFVHAEKRKILFLGNSYTYTNDLPNTLKQLALSLGDTIEYDTYCPGGATLQSLYNDANTLAKIQMPGWNYVIVQAQSQEPSFSPAQVEAETYPFAKKIDSLIHLSHPCAETVFYMTWGRKNGDAGNCAAYPPVCTYEGMQQRLRESYLEMSDDNNATCSPVGVAWRTFRTQYPAVELYSPDESHPSVNGTYLAACVFYSTIYQKTAVGAGYVLAGVNAADAGNIQTVASNTVLDSIENWQQYGSLPFANFSFTVNQNQVSFTNASMRASLYDWDFGDLSPVDNTANPSHTYTAIGNYTVKLTSKNNCNKYSVKNKVVNITSIPNNISDIYSSDKEIIFFQNEKLNFRMTVSEIKIVSMQGQIVLREKLLPHAPSVDCSFLPKGIYFYKATTKENKIVSGKFIVP